MTGYVLRRSAVSAVLLTTLLAAAGTVLVVLGVPLWVPFVLSVALVVGQWALSPYFIQWLIPATVVPYAEGRYQTDHLLGEVVARRCAEAGVRPVRLGVIDDGTPNAFTFGHTRADARIYVSRGLLDRLDEQELDAVISHEVGHVRHNDVLVMAIAGTVPLVLYYAYLSLRGNRNPNVVAATVAAYAGFLLSQLAVLALSRARELSADHYSCQVTGDGDALCRALVSIGYGMGRADADRAARAAELHRAKDKDGLRAFGKVERRAERMRAAGMFGIADAGQSATVLAAAERGLDPVAAIGALRWESRHPWARFSELVSTHPLIVRRVAALEASGLPGAPRRWHTSDAIEPRSGDRELKRARRHFWLELPVRFLPWLAALLALGAWSDAGTLQVAQAATVFGVALLVRTAMQRPLRPSVPVPGITSLLSRLDAGPMSGLPVEVRGRVTGRAMPGYLLSPDVVVQDQTGFVPVLYRQPWPFARKFFGLLDVPTLIDQDVVVRGWYRRLPTPVIELRHLQPVDGRRVRGYFWLGCYALGVGTTTAGAVAWAILAHAA